MSIIPQNIINSYSKSEKGREYTAGDLVVRFAECEKRSTQACATESTQFETEWRTSFRNA